MRVYDGISVKYPGDAQSIAQAAAAEMANRFPPGQTSLSLVKTDTSFSEDFEAALRGHGFSVGSGAGIEVGYTLDEIREEAVPSCYLQVRTSDGGSFGLVRPITNSPRSAASSTSVHSLPAQEPVSSNFAVQELPLPASQPEQAAAPLLATAAPVPMLPAPPYKVRVKATAEQIAIRNNVPVDDFCRWNNVSPDMTLPAGYKIYLKEPAGKKNQATDMAIPMEVPVWPPALPLTSPPAVVPVTAPVQPIPQIPQITSMSVPLHQDGDWLIVPGKLHAQRAAWASKASYQLVWKAQNDFEMESHASFRGSFIKAIQDLFTGMHKRGLGLRVTIFQGNQVVEVTEE